MAYNGGMSSTHTTGYYALAAEAIDAEGIAAWFGGLAVGMVDAVDALGAALEATDGTDAWTPAGDDHAWTATPALAAEARRFAAAVLAATTVPVVADDNWAVDTTAAWCAATGATETILPWDDYDIDYGTLAGAATLDGTVWLIEVDPQAGTAGAFRTAAEATRADQ